MGMNYYHFQNVCPKCGHGQRTHIGKASAGWAFSFHGTPEIRSWREWLNILEASGEIQDEDGRVMPLDDFKAMVEDKLKETRHHAREFPSQYPFQCWTDLEGHSFIGYRFL